jgi:ribosomal protein S13
MFIFQTVISDKKRIDIALLNCFGLSHTSTTPILIRLGFNFNETTKMIRKKHHLNIIKMDWFVPKIIRRMRIKHGLKLRYLLYNKIRILKRIKTLRGFKHNLFLPVRGQRTRKNAQTQKSKRVNRRRLPIAKKKK